MSSAKMHTGEIDTDAGLVSRLLAAQFPQWAGRPVRAVPGTGTEHAIYRVGDDLAVRLPRLPGSAAAVDRAHRLLPRLAPLLPLPIPVPVGKGRPADGYPQPWSVYRWLDGDPAWPVTDPTTLVADLAGFVRAMRGVDLDGGPPGYRGGPLARQDSSVRAALAQLSGDVDVDGLTSVWEAALAAPAWVGPPVWTHGDLLPANLLTRGGRLAAVLDFGCAGIGDPACDAMAAWTVLDAASRGSFRDTVGYDDATWSRGRGWALCFAVVALPYYRLTNPVLAGTARRTVAAVLADR